MPMRLFIALELPAALRDPLTAFLSRQDRVGGLRWGAAAQLHVTLWFLGEVDESRVLRICEIVASAATEIAPIEVRLSGLGVFPTIERPRVLYAALDDPRGGCEQLRERMTAPLEAEGFMRDEREFTPHITLARCNDARGRRQLGEILADSTNGLMDADATLDECVMFQSVLRPSGAEYVALCRATLGAR